MSEVIKIILKEKLRDTVSLTRQSVFKIMVTREAVYLKFRYRSEYKGLLQLLCKNE